MPVKTLILLFLLKVMAGIAYAYFYSLPAYKPNSDTFRFFNYSLQETDTLLNNPFKFFRELFTYNYSSSGNIFIAKESYWNDLKSNIIIKLLAILNVFTFKNYYANIVWYNFIAMAGIIGFYRVMANIYNTKKLLLIITIFCLPSFLFWGSGIHKDGLIFCAIGLILYAFYFGITNVFTYKKIFLLGLCFAFLFVLRNYIAIALFVALLAYYLAHNKRHFVKIYCWVYGIAGVLFLVSINFKANYNLPNYIVQKQLEFLQLSGGSSIAITPLQPTIKSFVLFLPQAMDIAFLRPHFTEWKNKSYIPATLETYILVAIIIAFAFLKNKSVQIPSFIYALFFFALSVMLIYGYTITFSGAIIRYKSIFLPLIFAPIMCMLPLSWVKNFKP